MNHQILSTLFINWNFALTSLFHPSITENDRIPFDVIGKQISWGCKSRPQFYLSGKQLKGMVARNVTQSRTPCYRASSRTHQFGAPFERNGIM